MPPNSNRADGAKHSAFQNLRPHAELELLHKAVVHAKQPRSARYIELLHIEAGGGRALHQRLEHRLRGVRMRDEAGWDVGRLGGAAPACERWR